MKKWMALILCLALFAGCVTSSPSSNSSGRVSSERASRPAASSVPASSGQAESSVPESSMPVSSEVTSSSEPVSSAAPPSELTASSEPKTPPSGNVDSKLVGNWGRNVLSSNGQMRYWEMWLNEDGTFRYFLVTTAEQSYKGNYTVSNGKIYFTNVVFTNEDFKENQSDSFVDYTFGTDSEGNERLEITNTGDSFTGSIYLRRLAN